MGGNAVDQGIAIADASARGQVKHFDVGSMLSDGVIGSIAGAAGGRGAGSKSLTRLGQQSTKRVVNAAKRGGLTAAKKEASKAASYFGKNAKHIVKPFTQAMKKAAAVTILGTTAKGLMWNKKILRG